MGSKREEERKEKIIRGLMKLPPNRRCINCNSLGPQYACTTFWTFVCMTCSGIHREFTHRVKSVSMSKFTSPEVDALQKGGNQRARELYLKAWDPERERLPDSSNADKIREFIKKVYVEKRYAVEKSSDRPPRDPQSIRSHEQDTRRASSYHSYSQSPPYDFQYEERRYGKRLTSLTRKPGSDHILYEGRFSSFSSPSHSSYHGNDGRFTNEGSINRSFSSGIDPYRGNITSPSPQTDIGSPFSDTSSYFSRETPGHPAILPSSDANNQTTEGRMTQTQRTASSGSFESFDSMSFKSVNSMSFEEVVSEPEKLLVISHGETSSVTSVSQSSTVANFSGVDLLSEPVAPQSVTSTPTSVCEPQLSAAQSVDLFQQPPISSSPLFSDHQSGASSCSLISDTVHHNGGWATFDMPQNLLTADDSVLAVVPSNGRNNPRKYNPFSLDQYSSSQNLISHEPSGPTYTLCHDDLQNVEPIANNALIWNSFEDSSGQRPIQNTLKSSSQDAQVCSSDTIKSLGVGVYPEALNIDGNVKASDVIELPFGSYPHFSEAFHDFPVAPAVAGVPSSIKPGNPFDLPCDADFESNNMFWNMSSLQAALPNNQMLAPCVVDASRICFPQYPIPSCVPGGVTFGPESGPFGFIVGQTPSTNITSIPTEAPVASVGGNPFA